MLQSIRRDLLMPFKSTVIKNVLRFLRQSCLVINSINNRNRCWVSPRHISRCINTEHFASHGTRPILVVDRQLSLLNGQLSMLHHLQTVLVLLMLLSLFLQLLPLFILLSLLRQKIYLLPNRLHLRSRFQGLITIILHSCASSIQLRYQFILPLTLIGQIRLPILEYPLLQHLFWCLSSPTPLCRRPRLLTHCSGACHCAKI